MRKLLALLGLAVAFAAGSTTAHAQFPCYGGGFGGGFSSYGSGYSYYVGSDRPPFYAMHPPVYYSYPVPRPYGYSPFAYPPGTMTPEVLSGLSSTIINPHVSPEVLPSQPKASAKESSNRVTSKDHLQRIKVVSNPFVTLAGE